jgi:hypothetical protein
MLNALEVAGKIFDLPALVGAYFFALLTTARAQPFHCTQLVDMGGDREIFEVGKMTPALAPFHASQLLFRVWRGWEVAWMDWLVIHLLGEIQQQLGQFASRSQTIRAGPVIPFLISLQFQL